MRYVRTRIVIEQSFNKENEIVYISITCAGKINLNLGFNDLQCLYSSIKFLKFLLIFESENREYKHGLYHYYK